MPPANVPKPVIVPRKTIDQGQGGVAIEHRFSDAVTLNVESRTGKSKKSRGLAIP